MTNSVSRPSVTSLAPPVKFDFPTVGKSMREKMMVAAMCAVMDLRKDPSGNRLYAWCKSPDPAQNYADHKEIMEEVLAWHDPRDGEYITVEVGVSPVKGEPCLIFRRHFFVPSRPPAEAIKPAHPRIA